MEKHHAFWWAIIVVAGLFTGLYGVELLELSQGTQLQLSSAGDSLTGFAVSDGVTGFAASETESIVFDTAEDISDGLSHQTTFTYDPKAVIDSHAGKPAIIGKWEPSGFYFKDGNNYLITFTPKSKSDGSKVEGELRIRDSNLKILKDIKEFTFLKGGKVQSIPIPGGKFSVELSAPKMTANSFDLKIQKLAAKEDVVEPLSTSGAGCPVSLSNYDVNKDGAVDEKDLQNFVAANPTLTGKAGVCTTCPVCKVCPESGEAAPTEVSEEETEAITAHSPSITINAVKSIPSGTKYTFTVEATDEDGDAVTEITAAAKGIGGAHDVTFKVGSITKTANVYKATVTWDKAVQGEYTATITAKSGGKGAAITSKELSNTNTFELTVTASGSKAGGSVKINIPGIAVAIPSLPKVETTPSSSVGRGKVVPEESGEGEQVMVPVIKPTLGTGKIGPLATCNTLADCKKNEKCKGKWVPDKATKPQDGGGYCVWSQADKKQTDLRKNLCNKADACVNMDGICFNANKINKDNPAYFCGSGKFSNTWLKCGVDIGKKIAITPGNAFCGDDGKWATMPEKSSSSIVKVDLKVVADNEVKYPNAFKNNWMHIGDSTGDSSFQAKGYIPPKELTVPFSLPYIIGSNELVFNVKGVDYTGTKIAVPSQQSPDISWTPPGENVAGIQDLLFNSCTKSIDTSDTTENMGGMESTTVGTLCSGGYVFYHWKKDQVSYNLKFNLASKKDNLDDIEIKDVYARTGVISTDATYFDGNLKDKTYTFSSTYVPNAEDDVKLRFYVYGMKYPTSENDVSINKYITKIKLNKNEYILNAFEAKRAGLGESDAKPNNCAITAWKDMDKIEVKINSGDLNGDKTKPTNTLTINRGFYKPETEITYDKFVVSRIELVVNEDSKSTYDVGKIVPTGGTTLCDSA